jgi:hypothetical protein
MPLKAQKARKSTWDLLFFEFVVFVAPRTHTIARQLAALRVDVWVAEVQLP